MMRRIRSEREKLTGYSRIIAGFSPVLRLRDARMRTASFEDRLDGLMDAVIMKNRHRLELAAASLSHLSPLERLGGGYSYVSDSMGKPLTSVDGIEAGSRIDVRLKDGKVRASVEEIMKEEVFQRK